LLLFHSAVLRQWLILAAAIILAPMAASGQAVTVTVPGSSHIGLAGAQPGQSLGAASSPLNDPVELQIPFTAGEEILIEASGRVSDRWHGVSAGPDGSSEYGRTEYRSIPGLSSITAPYLCLAGVFLGENVAATAYPPHLNFTGAALELETVRPVLQQVFFIGDGRTSSGLPQRFVAPPGAKRLFIGLVRYEFEVPSGSFAVKASIYDIRGYLPQIAHGGGWRTSLLLLNTGSSRAAYKLRFYNGQGAEYTPAPAPGSAPFESNLPDGSAAAIELAGGAEVAQGWCLVRGSPDINALAVFRQTVPGRPDFEASVLMGERDRRLIIPVEVMGQYTTGVALVNPEASAQTIRLALRDARGIEAGHATVALPPNGHTTFALGTAQAPAGLPGGVSGVLEIQAETGLRVAAIGLRFNLAGGAFTTLPVVRVP
jgi:hypothetical protein